MQTMPLRRRIPPARASAHPAAAPAGAGGDDVSEKLPTVKKLHADLRLIMGDPEAFAGTINADRLAVARRVLWLATQPDVDGGQLSTMSDHELLALIEGKP